MKDFKLMLAPMEDIIGPAFRTICHEQGADLTFTEMARIDSLARQNKSTIEKIQLKDKTPTCIQLIGNNEVMLEKFLQTFQPTPGFEGFNINAGCPSPEFVNHGMGCALVKRSTKINNMIKLINKKGFQASIKLRLGMNAFEKQTKNYLRLIKETNAEFFIVHARHGKDTYTQKADFSVYPECVDTGKNIIANGDINTKEQIKQLTKQGLKGVMIGRAAIKEPSIFSKLKERKTITNQELMKHYIQLSNEMNENPKYKKNIIKFSQSKIFTNL